jgi:hypothetical protein
MAAASHVEGHHLARKEVRVLESERYGVSVEHQATMSVSGFNPNRRVIGKQQGA